MKGLYMRSLKFGFEVRRRISKHGYFTEANCKYFNKIFNDFI